MRIPRLAGILSVSSTALAALAHSAARAAPPSIDSLGTLQVLKYNNLGPENNGTAAVLIYDRLDQSKAQAQCAVIGEGLYPLADDASDSDLRHQLDYLILSNSLRADDLLWVANGPSSEDCVAYSSGRKVLVPQPCHSQLPAICTASVPPSTDKNRTAVESSKLSIDVDGYTVTGYRDARSFRFLRVPFADPPVDNLRFAPPQPYSGSKEIDATVLPDGCIQSLSMGPLGNGKISEDCLFLSVYTPVLPSPRSSHKVPRKPVAVYFYGGSFTLGTVSQIDYDGGNFASRNDVVVVTVNYRLGALGFLATNQTTGSNGIRDQILALEWVNKHIESFGGDPSRVTIFGESAGGQSVVALLSSSAASGLFSGAISQSAPMDLPWLTRDVYTEFIVPEVATAVGCNHTVSEEALISCLRNVPATSFLDDSPEFTIAVKAITDQVGTHYLNVSAIINAPEPFMPMIDDSETGVVDDQFKRLLARQALPNRVPTLFSTVTDEAMLFGSTVPSLGSSQAARNKILGSMFPPQLVKNLVSSGAYPINASDPDSARAVSLGALTHRVWSCSLAYLLRNGGQYAFPSLYEVEISQGHALMNALPEECSPNDKYNATCHAGDVLPVWGTLNSKTLGVQPYFDESDIQHSQLLNDMFSSFFHSYNPNPDPATLKARGPAYAATYEVFGHDQYQVPAYRPEADTISLLGMPPGKTENPGMSKKCVPFDDYGYTFHHIERFDS